MPTGMAKTDTQSLASDGAISDQSEAAQIEVEEEEDYVDDSSSGSDEEEVIPKSRSNITWTGYGKKTPVILFKADNIVSKSPEIKALGEKHHLAFKIVKTECKLLRTVLYAHGFHETHPNSNDYNLLWTGSHLKPYVLRGLQEFQKINHFPRSYEITRKDRLFKNIQRLQQTKGFKNFDFIPQSYIIPSEFQEFCSNYLKDKGPWIVKPVASSRGRGIFLVNHPEQVPLDETMIVSKYIQNPLVIDGFKFDIRLYVAVTSYDPLVVYLYEEGLTRFATVKYEKSLKHIRNQCMHLTNYSVNKKSNDYVKNDDPDVEDFGNKWSLGAMLRYLRSIGKDTTAMMMRIEDVLIKTLLSAEVPIATACKMFMPYRGNCFELYGFDILVDENLRPWVLEVNLSPSLACDSPLDLKIKSNMMADLFSLVGFVCQDPMVRKAPTKIPEGRPSSRCQSSLSGRPVSSPALRKGRPQSANSNKGSSNGVRATGLTGEEIRVVRKAKEEYQRKGGWVRIFPSADSWELYGSFLQYSSTLNFTLYSQLYPDRARNVSSKPTTASYSSNMARTKSIHLHSAQNPQLHLSSQPDQALAAALQRSAQYERKLSCLGQKRKSAKQNGLRTQKNASTSVSGAPVTKGAFKGTLVQGVPEDVVLQKPPVPQIQPIPKSAASTKSSSTRPESPKPASERTPSPPPEDKKEERLTPPPEVRQPSREERMDVVSLLESGKTLSKVQARFAFATYLTRVQHRLMAETNGHDEDDAESANEQMDLVLRFLKRAAGNLQQPFKVVVPSRKLALNDRRRILAKQLGDFVHIYNKETEVLRQRNNYDKRQSKRPPSFTQNEGLDDVRFSKFVNCASENDLEEVLTTYTKMNKSASIFLGSNSSSRTENGHKNHNHHSHHTESTSLSRRKEGGDSFRSNAMAEETQITRAVDCHGDVASIATDRSAAYMKAVTIYSHKLGSRGLRAATRPSSASLAKKVSMGSAQMKAVRPQSAAGATHADEYHEDPYDEEAINSALQRLAVRQQQRQYAAGSKGFVALSHDEPPKRERKPVELNSYPDDHDRPAMTQHQQLRQLRMSEQSRALLEHSKAKHQAMVAQAHAAKSQPPITFHTAPQVVHQMHSHTLPMDEEEVAHEANRAPKPPIKPATIRKPTSTHRMARTNFLDDQEVYNHSKYDHYTGTSKPVYSSGYNVGY